MVENDLTNSKHVLDTAILRITKTIIKKLFCKNVMQYSTNVCSILHINTTASIFKFLFVFFLSEYSRKHVTVSGNPNKRTVLNFARLWPPTKRPF